MSSLAGILSISRRATIVDIARLADVSTATVDRVLNGRQGVKETTVKRVMKAAAELGYVDESDERIRDVRPLAQISFILPQGTNRYITMLGRMISEMAPQLERFSIKPTVEYIDSFNPDLLAKTLQSGGFEEPDGAGLKLWFPVWEWANFPKREWWAGWFSQPATGMG